MPPASGAWSGCHGVRVDGDFDLGTAAGEPVADAGVTVGRVADPVGDAIWTARGETTMDGRTVIVDRHLFRTAASTVVLVGDTGPKVEVDGPGRSIRIEPGPVEQQLQLLATFALPLIVNQTPALVMHAAAFESGDGAVLVIGTSGAGKSTLLVAAADAGWAPISEDLCAVDFRGNSPVVWPGPPWVRIRKGEPGPAAARVRFPTPDKAAWDIGDRQPRRPVRVAGVIALDPSERARAVEPLDPAAAVPVLAPQALWLGDPAERSGALFASTVDLAQRVRVSRVGGYRGLRGNELVDLVVSR